MAKPVLVSGIQPSGKLHIGNYLGALRNFVDLQNSGRYECFFFIADLHSLTEEYVPAKKAEQIIALAKDFLAAGLDPKKSVIFLQSQVPAHSELAWILNTITPMGELKRMTQFKDKANLNYLENYDEIDPPGNRRFTTANEVYEQIEKKSEVANVGLFDYPVLMAADILLYDAAFVPVGDDQDQHLELARTLARKFNSKFGATFTEPKALHAPTPRVMSLDDPAKKMSKSRPAGCLFLDDSPEEIRRKVTTATTDSGKEVKNDPNSKPGVTNLLSLYTAVTGESATALEKRYAGKGYAEFKRDLAETVAQFLAPFQAAKRKVTDATVKKVLSSGGEKANTVAEQKLAGVKKKLGILL